MVRNTKIRDGGKEERGEAENEGETGRDRQKQIETGGDIPSTSQVIHCKKPISRSVAHILKNGSLDFTLAENQ